MGTQVRDLTPLEDAAELLRELDYKVDAVYGLWSAADSYTGNDECVYIDGAGKPRSAALMTRERPGKAKGSLTTARVWDGWGPPPAGLSCAA